ncbi:MAG: LysR family transcriptional regulator [Rhodoferax sp.]|nr:LysR family transcriptional regulator [Rhodoferax sp.]
MVLSQRSFQSGLPVSISNADAQWAANKVNALRARWNGATPEHIAHDPCACTHFISHGLSPLYFLDSSAKMHGSSSDRRDFRDGTCIREMDSLNAWHRSDQYQGLPQALQHMRFNKLDLNLLVALDALLTERNISRAGQRIHLSQPATSNALARLRDYFQDELLIPHGRQLLLSSRAQELIAPVREILMRIDSTIATQPQFDPTDTMRKFVLLMSDFSAAVFVPALIERLYNEAPGICLDLRLLNERPLEQLEENEVDLLIIPSQYVSEHHPSTPLFQEVYMCVTWESNTRIQNELSFDDYVEVRARSGKLLGQQHEGPCF